MTEEWRPVVGYEELYSVSSRGRVKRTARTAGTRPNPILSPAPGERGHMQVSLHRNGKGRTLYVHTLVLEAFIGPRPLGMEACHKDGKPGNNKVGNLYWGTHKKNMEDSVAHGTSKNRARGEDRKNTKLTEAKVRRIRNRLADGGSRRKVAAEFNVTRGAINSIAKGESWAWLV